MTVQSLRNPRPAAGADIALAVTGVNKHFAGTSALVDAHLRVRTGTVHALLGGNGSGKSTLLKCLTGVHRADSGSVSALGHHWPAPEMTAKRAHEAGLRVVHQDLGLFERMTVAENFAFDTGFPRRRGGGIAWQRLHDRVAQLLERYGIDADPTTPVHALRPAARTLVAVARVLQDQEGSEYILLLDEPTASLPDHESRALLSVLRQRAALGQTIVLVSHRTQEVLDTADDFTVFRDGRVAGTLYDERPSEDALVELIAGRSVDRARTSAAADLSSPMLEVRGLTAGPLHDVDVTVHAGEVVGVAGLLGSGRSTLLSAIFGLQPPTSGTVHVDGHALSPDGGVANAMSHGVALVPQDRLNDATFPTMSVRHNASVAVLSRYWRAWMRGPAERRDTDALLKRFAIVATGVDAPFMSLSGGNQQKVVLARWMRRDPALLLLDEPTQGVDVMSRAEIYGNVRTFARSGRAVLIASSDFAELCQLCDRVLVLKDGGVAGSVAADNLSVDHLTHLVHAADMRQGAST